MAYATAVFAYWLGIYRSQPDVLRACEATPAFDQLLVRVALSKLLVYHELLTDGVPQQLDTRQFQEVQQRLIAWLDR